MRYKYKIVLVTLCLVSINVWAEDSLSTVMARMKPENAIRIRYQETRYLELLESPWKGSGYIYAMPPDLMIKEQYYPSREVMGAIGNKMYYYDPVNNVHHQGKLENDDAISLNVSAFKALVNGDQQLLKELYRIEFCSTPELWTLTLKARDQANTDELEKIEISGKPEQAADKIVVFMKDGDRNDYTLKQDGAGEPIKNTLMQIQAELLKD